MHADVLIVTVTKVESQAVLQVFSEATGQQAKPASVGDRLYHDLGIVNAARVFMVQSEMGSVGPGATLPTVQKGIAALSPSAVIMAGIAFGVDDKKQSVGDVLVSKQLMLYESQRTGVQEGERRDIPRGARADAPPRLLNLFRNAELLWQGPPVHFGLILSGEKLVDNLQFREELLKMEPEAIGERS
jgi:nucleoside phosphorylase